MSSRRKQSVSNKKQKSIKAPTSNHEEVSPNEPPPSNKKSIILLLSAGILLLAIFWESLVSWSQPAAPTDKYSRLTAVFPVGGKVQAQNITDGEAGLFAKKRIKKGEVIMTIDARDVLPDPSTKGASWYPQLVELVETALSEYPEKERPSVQGMITAIVLLTEVSKGEKSRWHPYIEALPRNVSQVAWYWSKDEMKCVVPRLNRTKCAETLQSTLKNFHTAFDSIWKDFRPLFHLPKPSWQQAEWAYLMIKTRSFTEELIPSIDMTNHDATKSVSIFTLADGSSHVLAARDYEKGEQVFLKYTKLTPSNMAESYGFLDANAAYVNALSISHDLQSSPKTRDTEMCVKGEMLFFGNVTEGRVEARFQHLSQTTYYKPFHPTQLVYQCVRVLLQSEDGPTIGKYIADKLDQDVKVYENMVNAAHCQSESGNFPVIREVNAVTARLLRGALVVAQQAARGEIEYPDIQYP